MLEGIVPPHDLDIEAAILGAALLDSNLIDEAYDLLPDDFFSESHRRVWEAILALNKKESAIDVLAIASYLKDHDRLVQIGGMGYLVELLNAAPTLVAANFVANSKVIKDKSKARKIIAAGHRLAAMGYGYAKDFSSVEAYVEAAERELLKAIDAKSEDREASSAISLLEANGEALRTMQASGRVPGAPTGLPIFDRFTSGFHPGDLDILAARPGLGKTSLALQFACYQASHDNGAIMFSLEMPKEQIGYRIAANQGKLNLHLIRAAGLNQEDWLKYEQIVQSSKGWPLWVDDRSSISVLEMRAKARKIQSLLTKQGKRLTLIVVDYLQLMRGSSGSQNREREVAEISRELKGLAKDLGVTVLGLSQLNRSIETGESRRRPRLSDLRESGAIEQDADFVAFLYAEQATDQPILPVDLIIEKHRNGSTGVVPLDFQRPYTLFLERQSQ